MRHVRTRLLGASLLALLAAPAAAQVPLTPRALGTGGAYVGLARGHEAIFLNPANLGLRDGPRWSIALPQLAVGLTTVGPEVTDVRDYLNYDDLTEAERTELLAQIPESGAEAAVELRAPIAAIQTGNFGFGVAYTILGSHGVSKDVVELFFEGFDPNRRDYTVEGTGGRSARFWDFAAGYGRSVGPLSVGVTGHYYLLSSYSRSRAYDPSYLDLIAVRDIRVEYRGVSSEGGTGFGVDVGAALQPIPGLTLSAAVSNAVSSFNWEKELIGRRVVLDRGDFENSEFQDVRGEYQQSDERIGETPTDPRYAALAAGLLDDAELPATLRLGAAMSLPSGTDLSASFQESLTEGTLGGRWDRMVGVGVQQKLPVVRVRAGISTNLDGGSLIGGGLSLGPLELGVGRWTNTAQEIEGDSNGWVATFGLSARGK